MAVSVLQGEFLFSKTFAAWLAGQVSFLQFYNPEHFRGFGIGVANGALWTPLERKWLVTALFLSSFASYCVMDHQVNGPAGFTGAPIACKLLHVTLIPHLWMFLLGILIHWNFDRLRPWLEGKFLPYLLGYAVFMALLVTLIDHRSLPFYLAYLPSRILLALATIAAAYSARPLSQKLLGGTYISYGIYIYHSIVINVMAQLGWMSFLGAMPAVFAESIGLALASRGETRAGLQGGLATGAV